LFGLVLGQHEQARLEVADTPGEVGGVEGVAVCDQFGFLRPGEDPRGE